MRIPVVLPTVHVQVTEDGALRIDVDGDPHSVDNPLSRGDLHTALDQITTGTDCAVRVEVTEADGTTYADIATPPTQEPVPKSELTAQIDAPGINGTGFRPGEEIAIAYVVARQTANQDGTTALHLPPALLAAKRDGLVLIGMTSRVIANLD